MIGDVVGLGKTIICPKNLVPMWQHHVDTYGLRAKVLPISRAIQEYLAQSDSKCIPMRKRTRRTDEGT